MGETRVVQGAANRLDLAVHRCRRGDHIGAGTGGGHGLLAEVDQCCVVVDMSTVHHAAVAVVGVFAEARVGHDDHFRHGVLDNRGHARNQAAFFPGVAAVRVQVVGHAECHHRLDPGTGKTLDLTGQFLLGDSHHARHTGDRYEVVDFFFDENRQHQIVEGKFGFLKQATQLRGAAQATWAGLGELAGHGFPDWMLKQ